MVDSYSNKRDAGLDASEVPLYKSKSIQHTLLFVYKEGERRQLNNTTLGDNHLSISHDPTRLSDTIFFEWRMM